MAGYNGWRNRETWLVNLWFGDFFLDMDKDEITEEFIEEFIEEHVFEKIDRSSFLADMIDLTAIDYQELVEHYKAVD